MKCFYHHAVDAVAICKNCNRGICSDCCSELLNGVACKNRCEAEVEAINYLIDRNKTSYQKVSSAYSRNALIFLLMGILFFAFGVIDIAQNPTFGWLSLLCGIIFLIGALFYFSTGRKYIQKDTTNND